MRAENFLTERVKPLESSLIQIFQSQLSAGQWLRLSSPFGVNSFVQTIRGSFVQQIEPAKDVLWLQKIIVKPGVKVITIEPSADASSVKEVVRLFSMAFEQICGLQEVGKLVLQRSFQVFWYTSRSAPSLSRNICYLRKTDRRSSWEENALKNRCYSLLSRFSTSCFISAMVFAGKSL